jgi:HK97 gp10 family phage protein
MRVESRGMSEGQALSDALKQLPARVTKRILREALIDGAGEPIRKRMGQLAPYEPGPPDLRDSMTISNARPGSDAIGIAVGPARGFFYGIMQEWGTVRHGAQPFARPAFDQIAPASLGPIGQRIWTALAGRGIHRPTDLFDGSVESPGRLL